MRLFISTKCNTILRIKFVALAPFFLALCVINFHRQTKTFCSEGEIKVFLVFRHTTNCTPSTIRASTKPILEKLFLATKDTDVVGENWLSPTDLEAFLRELSAGLCLREGTPMCWWTAVVRTAPLCIFVFSLLHFSYTQCHSFASIGCDGFWGGAKVLHCFKPRWIF